MNWWEWLLVGMATGGSWPWWFAAFTAWSDWRHEQLVKQIRLL